MSQLLRIRPAETKTKLPHQRPLPANERRHSSRFTLHGGAIAAWDGGLAQVIDASSGGAKIRGLPPETEGAVSMALKLPFQVPLLLRSRVLRQSKELGRDSFWTAEFLEPVDLSARLGVSSILASALASDDSKTLVMAPPDSRLAVSMLALRDRGHCVQVVSSPLEVFWLLAADESYARLITHENSVSSVSSDMSDLLAEEFPRLDMQLWAAKFDDVVSTSREGQAEASRPVADDSLRSWIDSRVAAELELVTKSKARETSCLSCVGTVGLEDPDGPDFCSDCVGRSKQSALSEFYDDIGIAG